MTTVELEKYPTNYVKHKLCKTCNKVVDSLDEIELEKHGEHQIGEDDRTDSQILKDACDYLKKEKITAEELKLADYAEIIMQQYNFKTLEDTDEVLVYEDGVYRNNGKVVIRKECEKLIPDCNNHKVNEVIGVINRRTYESRKNFNNDLSRLVLENGILDLDTLEFSPKFDPGFLTTIKIPVSYEPDAKCPQFEKALDDWLSSEDKTTALELMGNILNTNKKNLEKSVICLGNGQNGKSSWLKVLEGIIGKENCSGISIHALQNERFAPAQLYGKLANIYPDISNRELNNLGKFKMLVSGDGFNVEFKGQDHFMMESFAKMFFSANEMPKIMDNTDSSFRRILILKFENEFSPGVNRIDDYDQILLKEKSGIFNLMIQHYKNLLKNNGFSFNQSIEKVRETITRESDKLREFVDTCLVKETGSYIIKKDLYQKYVEWCKFHNYEAYSINKLGNRLPNYGLKEDLKHIPDQTRIWTGHTWNFDNEWVRSNIKRQERL